ncbi:hypothetical protein KQ51_01539 [Candidatus Izimaplasma bacterium HR1]|jgi:hypothetical protein|uniref:hypothetical protein n=1 Tax=Candidatus Izimoplasma sp. HR1 TaxID=1541959 RepID=UPI0004F5A02E|nr:hypothetical protein KQ51_01539 [Candidatus Izimaplasma bacterium HR1]
MKKIFGLGLLLVIAFFFSAGATLSAETAYVGGPNYPFEEGQTEWYEENVDFGENLNVCVNGFESFGFNIWAGQDIFAGTIEVYINAQGNIEFHIDLIEGALVQEFHIYMYDEVYEIPLSRPAPGLAPYVVENLYMNDFTYEIPLTELVDYEDYYFIFHLALVDDDDQGTPPTDVDGETAYGGGPNGPGDGAWFYAMGFILIPCDEEPPGPEPETGVETAYAYFGENSYELWPWGWYSDYQEGIFPVYAGAGQNDLTKGTLVGYIEVVGLEVTFMPLEGFEAVGYHYYIGPEVPERIPGHWQTITDDIEEAIYMVFHLEIEGEFEDDGPPQGHGRKK